MGGHGSSAPKGWEQQSRGFSGRHVGEEEEKHQNRLVCVYSNHQMLR